MRYSPMIGKKAAALKAATDGAYRFIMLALMVVEVALLGYLVYVEAMHR